MPRFPLTALAASAIGLSACSVDFGGGDMLGANEMVSRNAQLAVQQCGEGKVGSVDTKGFTCVGEDVGR